MIRRDSFRSFLRISLQYKHFYLATIISKIILTLIALLFANTTRRLFDLAPKVPSSTIFPIIATFTVLATLRLVFTFLSEWFREILNTKITYTMRRKVLSHLKQLPLVYHESNHSSKSNNILFSELETAKDFFVNDILNLFTLPFSFCMIGVFLFTVHPILGGIAIIIGPAQLLSNYVMKRTFMKTIHQRNEVTRDVFFQMGETLSGIREVKANQMEKVLDNKFLEVCKRGISINTIYYSLLFFRDACNAYSGNVWTLIPKRFGHLIR